jgi:hypothetical protein
MDGGGTDVRICEQCGEEVPVGRAACPVCSTLYREGSSGVTPTSGDPDIAGGKPRWNARAGTRSSPLLPTPEARSEDRAVGTSALLIGTVVLMVLLVGGALLVATQVMDDDDTEPKDTRAPLVDRTGPHGQQRVSDPDAQLSWVMVDSVIRARAQQGVGPTGAAEWISSYGVIQGAWTENVRVVFVADDPVSSAVRLDYQASGCGGRILEKRSTRVLDAPAVRARIRCNQNGTVSNMDAVVFQSGKVPVVAWVEITGDRRLDTRDLDRLIDSFDPA